MTTRNMRYEKDDYIIDNDNRVRFRKSTNLESASRLFLYSTLSCLTYILNIFPVMNEEVLNPKILKVL